MKIPYKESAIKRIIKLQKDVLKSVDQLGCEQFEEVLEGYFGLNEKESEEFIRLLNKLEYLDVHYSALPQDWFFESYPKEFTKFKRKRKRYNLEVPKIEMSDRIEEEYQIIRKTIKQFRSLSGREKEIAIAKWPEEYHQALRKKEPGSDSPGYISKRILSKRWDITIYTIDKYRKNKKTWNY